MSFVGLYTGLSGIQASQAGLDIVSNNVANASTPGYTRQRVELAARDSFRSGNSQIGTGVDVQSIARLRDAFLDDRFRAAVGEQAASAIRAEFHTSLEFLSGEPELGLTSRIDKLWGAAEEWSNNPNDPSTRRAVLSELGSITDGFQATAMAWGRLGEDTAERRDIVVGQVNDTLQALEEYNTLLANAIPGRIGGEEFDRRDLLIDQLAQLTGATSRLQEDGSATITLGGVDLLSHPAGRATVTTDTAPPGGVGVIAAGTDLNQPPPILAADVTNTITGELGGLNRVVEVDLPTWRGQLDELASTLANAINAINQGGRLADGTAGGALLGFDPGNVSSTIALLTQDVGALSAASGPEELDGDGVLVAPAPFDGSNARLLADLRTLRIDGDGLGDPDGDTLEARLGNLVVGLAAEVRSSRASADAARGVATGSQLARAAEHGVSLDEEMVGLVRYQRSLEASARIMTAVDQMLDTLVNRVGIVGR